MKKTLDSTYTGFLRNICYADDKADKEEVLNILNQFKDTTSRAFFHLQTIPALFAIDYAKRDYIFWSDNVNLVTGYPAHVMLDNGLERTLHSMDKNFFKTYNEEVFPGTLSFFKEHKEHDPSRYIISFNHRIANAHGKMIDIYQRCMYITDRETGLPQYCIGIGIDITLFKKDRTIIHCIEEMNPETRQMNLIKYGYYHPYQEDFKLSKQEKSILLMMADGLSSKMIADKLKISVNTVSNHRSNMLRKTNTKNIAQLITFAARNEII